ncbi:MAG TPA: DPP IV N-terminal domain-containing protein [Pyrinomonadaceae bacterium]|nr:DPP IV N-terminal domain-containing protein [Pyrinomonadaceae bacterium]
MRYGDGNQKVLPVVGVGAGSPEPYFSTSHSSEGSLRDLTNAATVAFTRRSPVQRPVLTVASSNPTSGVHIVVFPNDIAGSGNGTTQFTRAYNRGTNITLTAPSSVNGNLFQKWQRDGEDVGPGTSISQVMERNHTFSAVYTTPPFLTVTSTNPGSGVNITVTPPDKNGASNGTTPFTRDYTQFAIVNLTAPITAGTSKFWKWQVDGVDYTQSAFTTLSMDAAHTATAIYVTVTPTPTPTPVPGAGTQPIAFVKPGTGGGLDVFLTNTDGTGVVNLTDAPGDDTRPAWSSDGTRLVYNCLRQPDGSVAAPRRICMRNADGTGFTVISDTLSEDFTPAWSRDGSKLAFSTGNIGVLPTLATMNPDGTFRVPNFSFQGAGNPDWSPDGFSIVLDIFNTIWVYKPLGSSLRLSTLTNDFRPRYSPDGSKIVFQSTRDGQSEIYVMNSDGANQTRLTNNPAADTAPAWSPDGTKILFTSLRDGPTSPALYLMNADGSNQTRVTAGSDGVWRVTPTMPVIFTEEGTTNAAAVNSMTFVRGPFKLLDSNVFSHDGRTRVMLFTSSLGVMAPPVLSTTVISVKANDITLPVENVGPMIGVNGTNGSYIIVRLPDGLPTGNLSLTVTVLGLTSEPRILRIVQ